MNAKDSNGINPWFLALAVSLATFMEVLDTTITNVSLTHIAGTLGASQDESTWVITSYLVANGIVLPLSGWLSGVLGRKRFFMMCIGAFTLASLACGLADSLGMLIVFRLIQGLAGGGLQPTQQAIILDAFPPEKRGAVFGITGLTMIVAPILGPTLGGLITDNFSWRWIFFMNVPVGIIALFLVNRMVYDPEHAKAKGLLSIDYIGLGFVVLGLGCLQLMLDKGQQLDWFSNNYIVLFAFLSIVGILSAIVWMTRQKDPAIDFKLLLKPSFGLSCMMIFFMGFALYGSSALLPIMVQSQFGYDATTAGLVLSPGGLSVIFLMPVAGRLIGKIQARYLVATGMALLTFGMWNTTHITPQSTYNDFVWMRITQVLGLPFLFIPISTLAFKDIAKESSSKASAIFALARNMGGSLGIAILASYETRRAQLHQSYLAESLSPTSQGYRALLSNYMQHLSEQASMGKIYRELLHQASLIAYNDTYRVMSYITGILVFVAIFIMPKNNPHSKKTAAAASEGVH